MNCQEFWNTVPQRGHDITEEQSAHLAGCSACSTQWQPHRVLAAGLHSMLEDWRQEQAPERVEMGLTAAFRMQHKFPARKQARQIWWKPVLAWASAAAAMVAIGVTLVHSPRPASTSPDSFAAPQRPSPTAPIVTAQQETGNDGDVDDDSSVLEEGFVRLPNAPRIEPNEAYDVVRVAFPGSAMIALGLSVSDDRAAETVLADVALGADGTARAVRLVSQGEGLLE